MKKIENGCFQGDVAFRKVDKLPKGAREVKSNIVAHSESGHHHVMEAPPKARAKVYETDNPLVGYIHVPGACPPGTGVDIVHQRPWRTHETVRLLGDKGTTWEIRRQREHTPEGWQRVND